MSQKDKIIKTAIGSLVALATVGTTVVTNTANAANGEQEKCYGVIKAGMNDCATANSSCAGSAKTDSQPDAWAFMPKGLCEKIVGASTKPIATSTAPAATTSTTNATPGDTTDTSSSTTDATTQTPTN